VFLTDTSGSTTAYEYLDGNETATINFLTDSAGDTTGYEYADATETATVDYLTDTAGDTTAYGYIDASDTVTFDFLTNTDGIATAIVLWDGSATTTIEEPIPEGTTTSSIAIETVSSSDVSNYLLSWSTAAHFISRQPTRAISHMMLLFVVSGIWIVFFGVS